MGEMLWKIEMSLRRTWCFVVGHGEMPGERWAYEPDYCPWCYVDWPQDRRELPKYMNRSYIWLVDRNWCWFNHLDEWLLKHARRLPSWWEY